MFRILVSFLVCALVLQPAYSKQKPKRESKNDPAFKVCMLTEGAIYRPPVYKLFASDVSGNIVFLVFGNVKNLSEPTQSVFCRFELNSENKYELILSDKGAEEAVAKVKRDIEYLKLKSGDPGYESYHKKLEAAGKELADRRLWIRDAYQYLSKLDYYPVPKDKTNLGHDN